MGEIKRKDPATDTPTAAAAAAAAAEDPAQQLFRDAQDVSESLRPTDADRLLVALTRLKNHIPLGVIDPTVAAASLGNDAEAAAIAEFENNQRLRILDEYLQASPEVPELFAAWDFINAHTLPRHEIQLVAALARILALTTPEATSLPHLRTTGVFIARKITTDYMKFMHRYVGGGLQRIALTAATLRLLTWIARQGQECATALYYAYDWDMKQFLTLLGAHYAPGSSSSSTSEAKAGSKRSRNDANDDDNNNDTNKDTNTDENDKAKPKKSNSNSSNKKSAASTTGSSFGDSPRTLCLRLMLEVARHADATVKTAMLESHSGSGLSAIYRDVDRDGYQMVLDILRTLYENLVMDNGIKRSVKLSHFGPGTMTKLVSLMSNQVDVQLASHVKAAYSFPVSKAAFAKRAAYPVSEVALANSGNEDEEDEEDGDDDDLVTDSIGALAFRFMMSICTRPGVALCFRDLSGWFPPSVLGSSAMLSLAVSTANEGSTDAASEATGANVESTGSDMKKPIQRILTQVLAGCSADSRLHRTLVVSILRQSPSLVPPFVAALNAAHFEPRPNIQFIGLTTLLIDLISAPIPPDPQRNTQQAATSTSDETSSTATATATLLPPPAVSSIIDHIVPAVLTKAALGRGLQHANRLVRFISLQLVTAVLAKLGLVCDWAKSHQTAMLMGGSGGSSVLQHEADRWSKMIASLRHSVQRRLPDFQIIVALFNQITSAGQPKQQQQQQQQQQQSSEDDGSSKQAWLELVRDAILRILDGYQRHFPAVVHEARFDFGKLIPAIIDQSNSGSNSTSSGSSNGNDSPADSPGEVQQISQTPCTTLLLFSILQHVPSGGSGFVWWSTSGSKPLNAPSNTHLSQLLSITVDKNVLLTVRQSARDLLHTLFAGSSAFAGCGEYGAAEVDMWLDAISNVARSCGENAMRTLIRAVDEAMSACITQPHRAADTALALAQSANFAGNVTLNNVDGDSLDDESTQHHQHHNQEQQDQRRQLPFSPFLIYFVDLVCSDAAASNTDCDFAAVASVVGQVVVDMLALHTDTASYFNSLRALQSRIEQGREETTLTRILPLYTLNGFIAMQSAHNGHMDIPLTSLSNIAEVAKCLKVTQPTLYAHLEGWFTTLISQNVTALDWFETLASIDMSFGRLLFRSFTAEQQNGDHEANLKLLMHNMPFQAAIACAGETDLSINPNSTAIILHLATKYIVSSTYPVELIERLVKLVVYRMFARDDIDPSFWCDVIVHVARFINSSKVKDAQFDAMWIALIRTLFTHPQIRGNVEQQLTSNKTSQWPRFFSHAISHLFDFMAASKSRFSEQLVRVLAATMEWFISQSVTVTISLISNPLPIDKIRTDFIKSMIRLSSSAIPFASSILVQQLDMALIQLTSSSTNEQLALDIICYLLPRMHQSSGACRTSQNDAQLASFLLKQWALIPSESSTLNRIEHAIASMIDSDLLPLPISSLQLQQQQQQQQSLPSLESQSMTSYLQSTSASQSTPTAIIDNGGNSVAVQLIRHIVNSWKLSPSSLTLLRRILPVSPSCRALFVSALKKNRSKNRKLLTVAHDAGDDVILQQFFSLVVGLTIDGSQQIDVQSAVGDFLCDFFDICKAHVIALLPAYLVPLQHLLQSAFKLSADVTSAISDAVLSQPVLNRCSAVLLKHSSAHDDGTQRISVLKSLLQRAMRSNDPASLHALSEQVASFQSGELDTTALSTIDVVALIEVPGQRSKSAVEHNLDKRSSGDVAFMSEGDDVAAGGVDPVKLGAARLALLTTLARSGLNTRVSSDILLQLTGDVTRLAAYFDDARNGAWIATLLAILLQTAASFNLAPHIVALLVTKYQACPDSAVDSALLSILLGQEARTGTSLLSTMLNWFSLPPSSIPVRASAVEQAAAIPVQTAIVTFLERLDTSRMYNSVTAFQYDASLDQPCTTSFATLDTDSTASSTNVNIKNVAYDVRFILPLIYQIFSAVSQDATVVAPRKLIETNCLPLAIVALAADCARVRALAYAILDTALPILENASKFRERNQVMPILNSVRQSLTRQAVAVDQRPSAANYSMDIDNGQKADEEYDSTLRLPTPMALFAALALSLTVTPAHFMYPAATRFFLSRPVIDHSDLPLFAAAMLTSDFVTARKEKQWVLRVLTHCLHTKEDVRILARHRSSSGGSVFSVLMSLFDSPAFISPGSPAQRAIVDVLYAASSLNAADLLVRKENMLGWLHAIISSRSGATSGSVVGGLAGLGDVIRADPDHVKMHPLMMPLVVSRLVRHALFNCQKGAAVRYFDSLATSTNSLLATLLGNLASGSSTVASPLAARYIMEVVAASLDSIALLARLAVDIKLQRDEQDDMYQNVTLRLDHILESSVKAIELCESHVILSKLLTSTSRSKSTVGSARSLTALDGDHSSVIASLYRHSVSLMSELVFASSSDVSLTMPSQPLALWTVRRGWIIGDERISMLMSLSRPSSNMQ